MGKTHACSDLKHHVHDAAGFVAAVERACNERGLRLTAIRARVLSLVAAAGKPIKAYDLLEQVRDGEGAGAAAPPTVYRALDFLPANGFILYKLESINACACHHLVERPVIGAVLDLRPLPLGDRTGRRQHRRLLDSAARALGFAPVQAQTSSACGLCAKCARAA